MDGKVSATGTRIVPAPPYLDDRQNVVDTSVQAAGEIRLAPSRGAPVESGRAAGSGLSRFDPTDAALALPVGGEVRSSSGVAQLVDPFVSLAEYKFAGFRKKRDIDDEQALSNFRDCLQAWMRNDHDINSRDTRGRTILHYAAQLQDKALESSTALDGKSLIDFLLDLGADPMCVDNLNLRAYDYAVCYGEEGLRVANKLVENMLRVCILPDSFWLRGIDGLLKSVRLLVRDKGVSK